MLVLMSYLFEKRGAMRRRKMGRRNSRRVFSAGAKRIHPKNGISDRPMRGGIRL